MKYLPDVDRIATRCVVPFLLATSSVGTMAHAQSSDPQPASAVSSSGDIIVTAQRREQSLLSVPIAISAIQGDQLVQRGVTDSSQLAALVPNLTVTSSYGKTEPTFSMRGISIGNEFSTNQASPVGVYVDDAYMSSPIQHGTQLYDLERVEVLRGPQGTLFGRNTTGGAVNIITRMPKLNGDNGYVEGGYGNYNAGHAQAALEVTPIDGVFGIRAAANFDRNDPHFPNVYPGGRDADGGTSYSGRIAMRIKPSSDLDINLKVYGSRDRLSQVALHSNRDGTPNTITGYSEAGLGFFQVDSDMLGFRRTSTYGFLGRVSYKLSDAVTLSSLTSRDIAKRHIANDSDASPINLSNNDWRSTSKQWNQELKASVHLDKLDLIVGGYYGRDTVSAGIHSELYYFLRDLGQPADPTFATGGAGIYDAFRQIRTSKALYAQADYRLSDHWSATAGFRYTWDKTKFADGTAYIGDYDFQPIVYTIGSATAPLPTMVGKNSEPTGRVAITYTFDSKAILYASFNHGYRAGAFNGSALTVAQLNYTKPEKVNAYEIGAKGHLFDRRLTFSGALFYMDYSDQQVLATATGQIYQLLLNANSVIYGAEGEVSATLSPDLTLRSSIGLLHTRYKSASFEGTNLKGNELPFAPQVTAQIGFDWTLADVAGGAIVFTPNVNYVSNQWFTIFNADLGDEPLHQSHYVKADASLTWTRDALSLRLWADNLFQKKYYSYGIDFSGSLGMQQFVPGEPRTYGATVRYKF